MRKRQNAVSKVRRSEGGWMRGEASLKNRRRGFLVRMGELMGEGYQILADKKRLDDSGSFSTKYSIFTQAPL